MSVGDHGVGAFKHPKCLHQRKTDHGMHLDCKLMCGYEKEI